jgi:hypothetical protein
MAATDRVKSVKEEPMADKIDGRPGVMAAYSPGAGGMSGGPVVDAAINADKQWHADPTMKWSIKDMYGISEMMEGQAFYEKDTAATNELMKFVEKTNRGVEAYRYRAKAEHINYLEADQAGADTIANIAENTV